MTKEYDFYQKVKATGMLVKVGKAAVPDNVSRWLFAERRPIDIVARTEGIEIALMQTAFNEIAYNRVRTITGDIFVASV